MTEAPKLRAPVFGKVEGLRPDTSGHNLVVKVIRHAMSWRLVNRGRPIAPLSAGLGQRAAQPTGPLLYGFWDQDGRRTASRGHAGGLELLLQRRRQRRSALRLPSPSALMVAGFGLMEIYLAIL